MQTDSTKNIVSAVTVSDLLVKTAKQNTFRLLTELIGLQVKLVHSQRQYANRLKKQFYFDPEFQTNTELPARTPAINIREVVSGKQTYTLDITEKVNLDLFDEIDNLITVSNTKSTTIDDREVTLEKLADYHLKLKELITDANIAIVLKPAYHNKDHFIESYHEAALHYFKGLDTPSRVAIVKDPLGSEPLKQFRNHFLKKSCEKLNNSVVTHQFLKICLLSAAALCHITEIDGFHSATNKDIVKAEERVRNVIVDIGNAIRGLERRHEDLYVNDTTPDMHLEQTRGMKKGPGNHGPGRPGPK